MISERKKNEIRRLLEDIVEYLDKPEYRRKSDGLHAFASQYVGDQWCGPFGHADDGDWNVNCDGVIGIIPDKEFKETYEYLK